VAVELIDISGLDVSTQDKVIADLIESEKKTPFDLEIPPLLRVFVHRRSANTIQYTLSFHHAILDGWSVASFQTELFLEYARLNVTKKQEEPLLKPLVSSFKKVVALETQALRSLEAKSFWSDYLAEYAIATVPPFEDDGQQRGGLNTFDIQVPPNLKSKLLQVANVLQVPLRTVLLAA